MENNRTTPPKPDEIEFSIFGPGYGEAIAVHLGEGKWILIDSCLEPVSKLPASLNYLNGLNVEVEKAVELVIITHWHDDHIRGISEIFKACESANIVISQALGGTQFLELVSLFDRTNTEVSLGTDEFARVCRLLEARKQRGMRINPPIYAVADRLLYQSRISLESETLEAKIYSLSPSDAAVSLSQIDFSRLIPEEGESKKRIPTQSPNHTSVVLWVEVGSRKLLLGADLEETNDPKTGWSVILDESKLSSNKGEVFKVPHHGSENAHSDRVWLSLLAEQPFAALTPFCKAIQPLPRNEDIERLLQLTPYVYLTSSVGPRRKKLRDNMVRKTVKEVTRTIYKAHSGWGHVRFRQKLNERSQPWAVELFGDAQAIVPKR